MAVLEAMLEKEIHDKSQEYCPACISLGDCVLPMPGWIPYPPSEKSAEMYAEYGGGLWRYKKCPHLQRAESEKQQSAAMAGKWKERTLDSYQITAGNKEAYSVAREYAKVINPFIKDGIVFAGPVGTGKTHLSAGILKVAYSRGLDGVMISVPDLLNEIRSGYTTGDGTKEEKVKSKFLVILDDLGAESVTDWVREKLFTLINHRYENQKPLIVTTNFSPAELTDRIGERTTDRLREMCRVVNIQGRSWRGK